MTDDWNGCKELLQSFYYVFIESNNKKFPMASFL